MRFHKRFGLIMSRVYCSFLWNCVVRANARSFHWEKLNSVETQWYYYLTRFFSKSEIFQEQKFWRKSQKWSAGIKEGKTYSNQNTSIMFLTKVSPIKYFLNLIISFTFTKKRLDLIFLKLSKYVCSYCFTGVTFTGISMAIFLIFLVFIIQSPIFFVNRRICFLHGKQFTFEEVFM